MPTPKTFIALKNIREYFIEECKERKIEYSEKGYLLFLDCCERDFYQWLDDNFKYFSSEYSAGAENN
jgi:hypothetical protein